MSLLYDLSGRVAVVTGGGSGIGAACVRSLAEAGSDVVAADLALEQAEEVCAGLADSSGRLLAVETDVSDPASMSHLGQTVKEEWGRLDLAVNSAGVGASPQEIEHYDLEAWRRVMSVNLDGVMLALRMQIPLMRTAGRGSIVNVGSILGHRGWPQVAAYVASKHAVVGLTAAAALETAEHSIRVNCVSPGFILTPLVQERHDDEERRNLAGRHPVNRLGTPDEVAATVMWLLSDASSFVTGADYAVDGGFLSR